tara:strand:+ start:3 stop:2195 length:2193 start_codon:yes stop_codon:yes gene_type:complete
MNGFFLFIYKCTTGLLKYLFTRFNLLILAMVILPLNFYGQSLLDSLETNLKTAKGKEKIIALLNLSEFYQSRDFQKAFKYADKAKYLAQQENDSSGLASAYEYIGYALTDLGELVQAIQNYQKSIEISLQINDSATLATAYNDLGYIFEIQSLNDQAINYYLKGLAIFEKLQDSISLAAMYNNIGMLYSDENRQTTAREYFFKSLKIKEKFSDERSLATTLNNIGVSYLEEAQSDSLKLNEAEKYFQKSLQLRLKAQDLPGIAQSYLNLSAVYAKKGNYNQAKQYADKAYDIHKINNNKLGIIQALDHLALFNREEGQYAIAIEQLQKAIKLAREINNKKIEMEGYLGLGKNYQAIGDYKNAALFLKKYIDLNDSIQAQNISTKINQIGLKYEFDKQLQQKEIEHLQQQHVNEIELNKQKFYNYIIGISLILVLIITIIIFKAYRDKQKANEIILQQKKIVEEQRQALQMALSDITDSVKYAQRIQQAILPSLKKLKELFNDIEIIFKPKDIVSGDFYWCSKQNNEKIFALADCTGHGVPGAFMSLLGYNALNKIVNEQKITAPNKILTELDNYITSTLKKTDNNKVIRDGMDISVITFTENNKLLMSGANNGIWIYRKAPSSGNYQLLELPADKQPIGYTKSNQMNKSFTLHEIDLLPNDLIILYTDGFADQFGGIKNKKLKVKTLKNEILKNADLPLNQLKSNLESFFDNWKGNQEQIDDVSLVFIKV